jgi:hypothetical protein
MVMFFCCPGFLRVYNNVSKITIFPTGSKGYVRRKRGSFLKKGVSFSKKKTPPPTPFLSGWDSGPGQ